MHVHTVVGDSRAIAALQRALADHAFLVLGLCAAWCDICGQFRADFESLAAEAPDKTFVWLDIEDDAEIVGDVDVANFPTIAVFHANRLVHFGVSLPQAGVVGRLLSSLARDHREAIADPAVHALRARLRERLAVVAS